MPNEEYQRLLRVEPDELPGRLLGDDASEALRALVSGLTREVLVAAIRDLGGHDLGLLVDTYRAVEDTRPPIIFAYTVKGRGLPTEGHPNNHSALLTEPQMVSLAEACGTTLDHPWKTFERVQHPNSAPDVPTS